jgi:hypothetical protein
LARGGKGVNGLAIIDPNGVGAFSQAVWGSDEALPSKNGRLKAEKPAWLLSHIILRICGRPLKSVLS